MRIFLRNFVLAALPLIIGFAVGYAFAASQQSCGRMVGPIFAAKCHGRVLQYRILFQTAGTAAGSLLASLLLTWLELRRRPRYCGETVAPSAADSQDRS